ncbi:MAG: FMN-binding protein [Bacilli bacterium]|jgi:electron transport complex protein RnfG|nr:FMN-binding protein [Bacilli bacterium]
MKIFKLTLFLTIVCAICAGVLYETNVLTAPSIAAYKEAKTNKMLKEMVPNATSFKTVEVDNTTLSAIHEIYVGDKQEGAVLEINSIGFQSELSYLVAVIDNKFQGFQVISQAETAGYGTQITEDKFKDQFINKDINSEIDTISGSTITSGSVKKGITQALKIYENEVKENGK